MSAIDALAVGGELFIEFITQQKNLGQEGKILAAIILDTNKTENKTPM